MRKLLVFVFALVSLYSNSQSICGGSSILLQATNTLALTGPSYSLNPGGFSSIGGTFVVSPNATTTYTLYTTGQNTNSAIVTTSVITTVTVFAQPVVTPTVVQATCTNSLNSVNLGLTFSPSTPVPSYTITWAPIPPNLTSPQQTTVNSLPPGPQNLTVSASPGGCSLAVTFTILPQPAPAIYSVIPFGSTFSITCSQPTLELSATNSALTYTWSGASFTPVASASITLNSTSLGTLIVVGQNTVSGCVTTNTFLLAQNISVPTSTISQTNININCTQTVAPTLSVTSTPTVNITHFILSPQGGTFIANTQPAIYNPGFPGTYTYVLLNDANGCSVTKNFTVTSSDSYPTYSVTSALHNFTLGCTTRSVATISIDGAATTPFPGGPVSYTIIGPPTSTAIPSGTLSILSTYTINVPGTWTVIVKDNTNQCETRTPISILQRTATPTFTSVVPRQILDCDNPTTILETVSELSNVSYNWGFQGVPGNVNGSTITVNTNITAPTQTLINNYTITVTNLSSTCKSTSVIPIYQNTFPPTTSISAASNVALTCNTPTVVLTNQSKTSIPTGFFVNTKFVQAYLWTGPTPQMPLQVNTTYTAGTVGTYTLVGKDLNNGCFSTGTFVVADNRNFPSVNQPPAVVTPAVIDCGSGVQSAILTPTPISAPGVVYTWSVPAGSPPTQTVGVSSFSVSGPGAYTVVATNTINGCKTTSVMTAINGSLTADFTVNEEQGFAPHTVVFTNNSSSSNNANNIFSLWSYGNGTSSGSTTPTGTFISGPISSTVSPQVTYSQPGTYTVTMYANKGSCIDTAFKVIKVEIPSSIVVPNVFTPNGDGINDIFFLKSKSLSEITISIYNRWGHIVYEVTSTTGNIEWDGKNGFGAESSEGTYFYLMKATGKDGKAYDQKGTISLFR